MAISAPKGDTHISTAMISSATSHGGIAALAWHIAMVNFNANARRRL
jgi:hypothetical protein